MSKNSFFISVIVQLCNDTVLTALRIFSSGLSISGLTDNLCICLFVCRFEVTALQPPSSFYSQETFLWMKLAHKWSRVGSLIWQFVGVVYATDLLMTRWHSLSWNWWFYKFVLSREWIQLGTLAHANLTGKKKSWEVLDENVLSWSPESLNP